MGPQALGFAGDFISTVGDFAPMTTMADVVFDQGTLVSFPGQSKLALTYKFYLMIFSGVKRVWVRKRVRLEQGQTRPRQDPRSLPKSSDRS